jgi:amidohydrolase
LGDLVLSDRLRNGSVELAGDMAELRHRLHRRPEIGLDLPETQETLLAELDGLGLELATGTALSSVVAVLRGGKAAGPGERPAVLLRADMDALPVHEASGVEFTSEIDGAMHACGHDLHMAMLVGAARLLAADRDALPGDVVFMLQPGEEGFDGAGRMLDEGVLDAAGPRVRSAYGMHVMSATYPVGRISSRPGTLMAASDWLKVTVRGRGGHGSAPHQTRDPIAAMAAMVTALHTFVTRRFDVFDPVVVTVGSIHGGTRRNIIPDEATFDATVRTFSAVARERMRTELPAMCRAVGAAHGVEVDADYREEYPLTVNDPGEQAFVAQTVAEVFDADDMHHTMHFPDAGAEDFSRVLDAVPGCYMMLGASTHTDPATSPSNHSPRASFSDDVLPTGALLHAELAVRALEREAVSP